MTQVATSTPNTVKKTNQNCVIIIRTKNGQGKLCNIHNIYPSPDPHANFLSICWICCVSTSTIFYDTAYSICQHLFSYQFELNLCVFAQRLDCYWILIPPTIPYTILPPRNHCFNFIPTYLGRHQAYLDIGIQVYQYKYMYIQLKKNRYFLRHY